MADLGDRSASNDHALRDVHTTLVWLNKTRAGPTGFRFLRIDAINPTHPVSLAEVRAVLVLRDIPQLGSFRSSDERLNRIWQTGAYTVHLNGISSYSMWWILIHEQHWPHHDDRTWRG